MKEYIARVGGNKIESCIPIKRIYGGFELFLILIDYYTANYGGYYDSDKERGDYGL